MNDQECQWEKGTDVVHLFPIKKKAEVVAGLCQNMEGALGAELIAAPQAQQGW